ncbi:MAG: MlaD family protein [Arcobacteraceae bacterium]|jgi:phospholipid/cholesterol/gamma-HCH transport system substrate-binding protein|nr:MCE family protein [Arcobacteraceae bacterium]
MENRVQYTLVGMFVFIVVVGLVIFLLWHGNYSKNRDYKYYQVNTIESVSGLNIKASVRLMGVNVGEVDKIYIDPNNSEIVCIIIKVDGKTPIKIDSYATLKPQGITGLMFLEIEGGSKDSSILKTTTDINKLGIIPTRPSLFSRYDTSLASLIAKLEQTLDAIEETFKDDGLFSNKNIKNIEMLLQNSSDLARNLSKLSSEISDEGVNIKKLIFDVSSAANAIEQTSKDLSSLSSSEESQKVMEALLHTIENISLLSDRLGSKLEDGEFDIGSILQENLQNSQNVIDELNILIKQLQNSPSDIIFKTNTKELGPGEKQ